MKLPATTNSFARLLQQTLVYSAVSLLVLLSSGCTKETAPAPLPQTTSLKIVVEEGFLPLPGALVKLYASQEDLLKDKGQIGSTQITNTKGEASFTALSPSKYYFRAEAGCRNNLNGSVTSTSALVRGAINTATVKVSPTGTLRVTNTTKDTYDVYANGYLVIDNMLAGTTQTLLSAPAGSWLIRVVQQSGYLLTPTEKTYSRYLTCGAIVDATI